jgi:glucose/arabinose dehydrogenase
MKKMLLAVILLAVMGVVVFAVPGRHRRSGNAASAQVPFREEVVLKGREVPWAIAFTPDGSMMFTERPGRLRLLQGGTLKPIPIPATDKIFTGGETGLMDLKLDPQFSSNSQLYFAYVYRLASGALRVRVVRFKLVAQGQQLSLTERKLIIEGIPASRRHCGTRLGFGPDGKLYVTTGDAHQGALAQRLNSLAGKTLRLNLDGTVPTDNPFVGQPGARPEIWSLGHRNAQGLDWQPGTGLMFQTEHGPSGDDGPGGGDEVNIVERGKNYGWPTIHHNQTHAGMELSILPTISGSSVAVAPASGAFYRGDLFPQYKNNFFFGCLVGKRIIRVVLDGRRVISHERLPLSGQYGRIREVVEGPGGTIYFSTSNCDGRGNCNASVKDRIVRLVPNTRAAR